MNPITLATNGTGAGRRFPIGRLGRVGGVAPAATLLSLLALLVTVSGALAVSTAETTNRVQRLTLLGVEETRVVTDPVPRVDETEKHQLLPNDGFHDAKPPADTADDPKAESDGDKSAQGDSGPGAR